MQTNMQSVVGNLLMAVLRKNTVDCLAIDFLKQMKLAFKSCGMDYKLHVHNENAV